MEAELKLITEFHKKIIEDKLPIYRNIKNNLGKTLEEYTVQLKKNKRFIEANEDLCTNKNFDLISRGENCIKKATESNYLNLLQRSMERGEICLGSNFVVGYREKISVIEITNCCYDLVEMDGIYYLSNLKRKKDVDIHELVKFFCNEEGLGKSSESFMLALISFPKEFFKCMDRYRLNKKQWEKDEFYKKIEKAYNKDGDSLF